MQKLLEKFNSLFKYGIAALLLVIPLYPKFPFINVPGTYVAVRIEDFLILILTTLFLLYFYREIPKLLKNKLELSVLIFTFVGLVSLISGLFLTKTVGLTLGFLHWLRRIEYFVPLGMGILYVRKFGIKSLEFFLKVTMITIVIAFIYGFGQKHFSWPVIITQNEEYSKGIALRWVPGSQINSTFAGHYDLATFLVLTLPFFVTLFFLLKGFWTRISLGVVIFSGLWLLTSAVSRISIVSYLLACLISLAILKKYLAATIVIIVSLVFFSMSGDVIARYGRLVGVYYQKIMSGAKIIYNISSPRNVFAADLVATSEALPVRRDIMNVTPTPVPVFEDRSTSIRLNVEWPRAIRAFEKNPLLGTGYSSITLATDNDFLRILGEAGILGFLSFLLIFANIGILIKKILPGISSLEPIEKGFVASYVGALVGVFLNSTFIDIFESSKFIMIFWLITGLFVSYVRSRLYVHNN